MSLSVDIHKKFSGFSLDVAFEAGNEILGFLGASGCGKSLTLRSIAGIEKPDEGKIIVNGTTFFDKAKGKRARVDLSPQERKTALLFQNYQLFPNLTVHQNIAAGASKNLSRDALGKLIEEQLRRFGLLGLEHRYPAQLSGGQQQRVALARMLAADPGILMLDEPFSALDAHLKSELEQNLLGLFAEHKGTILYISHDIDEAFRFCDRIAVVHDGHIEELREKDAIVSDPQSLATIQLSGCKNTTLAVKVDDHNVELPDWGITIYTEKHVPDDTRYFGVRASYIRAVTPEQIESEGLTTQNVFRVRADRVSDSRFERAVMFAFLDSTNEEVRHYDPHAREENLRFFKTHVQWKINKLSPLASKLPQQGDECLIYLPTKDIYLVSH